MNSEESESENEVKPAPNKAKGPFRGGAAKGPYRGGGAKGPFKGVLRRRSTTNWNTEIREPTQDAAALFYGSKRTQLSLLHGGGPSHTVARQFAPPDAESSTERKEKANIWSSTSQTWAFDQGGDDFSMICFPLWDV